ncbi:hypothetical protein E2C01_050905 [Portunus trituberculatus]|uniref:Uncharacterized protein n=1 Tax=Portunus trituberculatus TaxID=210409 RepID=A0A5B7GI61_PORTR|nr:hypothetical protein [Portunus trituberculatus]
MFDTRASTTHVPAARVSRSTSMKGTAAGGGKPLPSQLLILIHKQQENFVFFLERHDANAEKDVLWNCY